jgi:hypothetical protein
LAAHDDVNDRSGRPLHVDGIEDEYPVGLLEDRQQFVAEGATVDDLDLFGDPALRSREIT